MSEYIIRQGDIDMPDMVGGERITRCRDCRFATISTHGFAKYCEKFVLPDVDGYGCDPQVNLPLDFYCAWGEPREES